MKTRCSDRAEAGAESFGALTPDQLRELFLDFVIRSIEGKILSDIGANGVSLPSDVNRVIEIQDQVHDFISGCCRSHLPATLAEISGMTDRQLDGRRSRHTASGCLRNSVVASGASQHTKRGSQAHSLAQSCHAHTLDAYVKLKICHYERHHICNMRLRYVRRATNLETKPELVSIVLIK